jgi:hypothetical protein
MSIESAVLTAQFVRKHFGVLLLHRAYLSHCRHGNSDNECSGYRSISMTQLLFCFLFDGGLSVTCVVEVEDACEW